MMFVERKISILIQFSSALNQYRTKANAKVVDELLRISKSKKSEIYFSAKDIAERIGLPSRAVTTFIKQLYRKLIEGFESFTAQTWTIRQHAVEIYLYVPNHELKEMSEADVQTLSSRYTKFRFTSPVLPRIGEAVSLSFVNPKDRFDFGIVSEILHVFFGHKQEIQIFVHPLKDGNILLSRFTDSNYSERRKVMDRLLIRDQPFIKVTKKRPN